MRPVALLLAFFLSSVTCQSSCYQYYNGQKYDLSSLTVPSGEYAYSYTDKDNRLWYWNVCASVNGLIDINDEALSVSDASVAIFQTSENYTTAGSDIFVQMTVFLSGAGVRIALQGDICDPFPSRTRNVTMLFYCNTEAQYLTVTSIASEECSDVIYLQTAAACAVPITPINPINIVPPVAQSISSFGAIAIIVIVLVISGVLCSCIACCFIRRRNCRSHCKTACNKKYEMENLSFQPLPQAECSFVPNPMAGNLQPQQVQFLPQVMPTQQMAQQYPSYMYMQQPQQYYYMPVQGQQPFVVNQQPQQQELSVNGQ